ncbi:MAG: NADH-quinone oxidoreductase subunit N [Armatimonadetes bacterium]|nr:NADH-quinone oxidoreductase subunit N [Armatimonadota bacterium]
MSNLTALSLELITALAALLFLIADAMLPKEKRGYLGYGCIAFLGLLMFGALTMGGPETLSAFGGRIVLDPLALFFKQLSIAIVFLVALLSVDVMKKLPDGHGEFYPILLFILTGMMLLAGATEFVTIFIAIELISIPSYVLAGYHKHVFKSSEAGMKYFILGAFSSALLLYGMSLVYGATGSTQLSEISTALQKLPLESPVSSGFGALLFVGLVLMMAGFGFKIAAVPFHLWAPDVYEGAPSPVTAFLSVGPKAAGIAVIIRVFLLFLEPIQHHWAHLFVILAALSMVLGNLLAIPQRNLKRMLAYSGIAQIGYVLVGLVAATNLESPGGTAQLGISSAMFYMAAYVATNLAAFSVVVVFSCLLGKEEISDLKGLSRLYPGISFCMLIALLSLAGVPPLAGFMGKFYLFSAAWSAGFHWLVGLGVLCSVISLYYYFMVIRTMYFEESPIELKLSLTWPQKLALGVTTLSILFIGIYPSCISTVTLEAARLFLP